MHSYHKSTNSALSGFSTTFYTFDESEVNEKFHISTPLFYNVLSVLTFLNSTLFNINSVKILLRSVDSFGCYREKSTQNTYVVEYCLKSLRAHNLKHT